MAKFSQVFRKFPRTFWIANTMELFERWAWYGMFMLMALYLTGSTDTGALGFSHEQKGTMMGTVTAMLYILPILTGALADKFGYRRVLLIAFAVLSSGYFMMGFFHSYPAVFMAFVFLGIGAGLFKPVISATIAKTTTEETSSIGFGLFYMMVNIGAFIGPIVASKLRAGSWQNVFFMSSAILAVNFILVIFFYKEPERNATTEKLSQALKTVFKNIGSVIFDVKFVIFLLLIVGFWAMYNQLFYTLPSYIDDWVDTRPLYDAIASLSPALAQAIGTQQGTVAAEMMTNVDALYIILFQVLVSSLVMKWKPLSAMFTGIVVAAIGLSLAYWVHDPIFILLALLVFSLGEMACSPKVTEYVGRLAPPNKTGLYIGMSFIPLAGGNLLAGIISGGIYERMSDKITLLQHEVHLRNLSIPEISANFTKNDYLNEALRQMNMSPDQLRDFLYQSYHPERFWQVLLLIGLAAATGLFVYDRIVNKKNASKAKVENA
jgi:proton-dependent oligopeptide transporter, POT family